MENKKYRLTRKDEVLLYLLKYPESSPSGVEIARALGRYYGAVRDDLSWLENEAMVKKVGKGAWRITKRGIKKVAFKVKKLGMKEELKIIEKMEAEL